PSAARLCERAPAARRVVRAPALDRGRHVRVAPDGAAQVALDGGVAVLLDALTRGRRAQSENVDGDAVVARVDLGGEDLDALRGERAGDVCEEAVPVARADRELRARAVVPAPMPAERILAESADKAKVRRRLLGPTRAP